MLLFFLINIFCIFSLFSEPIKSLENQPLLHKPDRSKDVSQDLILTIINEIGRRNKKFFDTMGNPLMTALEEDNLHSIKNNLSQGSDVTNSARNQEFIKRLINFYKKEQFKGTKEIQNHRSSIIKYLESIRPR